MAVTMITVTQIWWILTSAHKYGPILGEDMSVPDSVTKLWLASTSAILYSERKLKYFRNSSHTPNFKPTLWCSCSHKHSSFSQIRVQLLQTCLNHNYSIPILSRSLAAAMRYNRFISRRHIEVILVQQTKQH